MIWLLDLNTLVYNYLQEYQLHIKTDLGCLPIYLIELVLDFVVSVYVLLCNQLD